MKAAEVLKIIVESVSVIAVVLGGLTIGAFLRFRKQVLLIEKEKALRKFYPQLRPADRTSEPKKTDQGSRLVKV